MDGVREESTSESSWPAATSASSISTSGDCSMSSPWIEYDVEGRVDREMR